MKKLLLYIKQWVGCHKICYEIIFSGQGHFRYFAKAPILVKYLYFLLQMLDMAVVCYSAFDKSVLYVCKHVHIDRVKCCPESWFQFRNGFQNWWTWFLIKHIPKSKEERADDFACHGITLLTIQKGYNTVRVICLWTGIIHLIFYKLFSYKIV